jgi:SAM-dependent methyltransferase
MAMSHAISQPSAWVMRWHRSIAQDGVVLDLACGSGRHTQLLRDAGYRIVAVDIDISGIGNFAGDAAITILQADLEGGPWPISDLSFDGVVVTNYLHRPTFSRLLASLKPGGVLIYETFAYGNGEFGRPSNPDFLLRPGELLEMLSGAARVMVFEDGYVDVPKPALVQRICAVKNGGAPRHFPL